MLKTRRFGYDGKGQSMVRDGIDPDAAWKEIGGQTAILEAFVPFEREISVVAARNAAGQIECFDVTENEHRDHILNVSRAPAAVSAEVATDALAIARKIGDAFDYVGVLAVEMFVVPEAAATACWSTRSRRACTIPATGRWTAPPSRNSSSTSGPSQAGRWRKPVRLGRVEMTNLIGPEVEDYARWLQEPGASVHLYGKATTREGRKMGHVTRVMPEGS